MVKKIKEKKDVAIFILVAFIINLMFNIIQGDWAGDQLWNFQNIYKINNGYKLYVDANAIITPFFYYVGRVFLMAFGNNMLAFEIYGSVINAMFLTFIYLIFRKMNIRKVNAIILIIYIYIITFPTLIGRSANYNLFALVWSMASIYLALKHMDSSIKRYNVKQGILCFLVLFTKQNIGVYYLIGLSTARFLISTSKKEEVKQLIKMYITVFVLWIVYLSYLLLCGTLYDFYFYTASGIGDFLHNTYIYFPAGIELNTFKFLIIYLICGYIIGMILLISNTINAEEKRKLGLCMIISLPMLFIAFPILELYHGIMGMHTAIVTVSYVYYLLISRVTIKRQLMQIIQICTLIPVTVVIVSFLQRSVQSYVLNENYAYVLNKESPFYMGIYPKSILDMKENIVDYIKKRKAQGINVIIIDETSPMYMIELNKSNGMFDCLNIGNMGKTGQDGAIELINNMDNTEILLRNEINEEFGEQYPKKVRKYVMDNLKYKGYLEYFMVYSTNMEGE